MCLSDLQLFDSSLKSLAPLKGEESPRRGEMSAKPTERGAELAADRLTEGMEKPDSRISRAFCYAAACSLQKVRGKNTNVSHKKTCAR